MSQPSSYGSELTIPGDSSTSELMAEDFFYRVNVFTIEVPPLRVRRPDIPLLTQHLLERFGRQMDTRVNSISPPCPLRCFSLHSRAEPA